MKVKQAVTAIATGAKFAVLLGVLAGCGGEGGSASGGGEPGEAFLTET